ncbi:G1 family glutamic endopeptidase [Streptomyces sp. NPDC048297]|uniref:G1 family glutamic endopeptidase n=1 Tax=Streptomyces sp. NPDC048297 TaxID=3365531 RepID=UPI00371F65A1
MRISSAGTVRRTPAACAAAGLVLAATALSPAASAATAMPTLRFEPTARYQSGDSNWGGYVTQGSFTKITGTWTQPHVVCRSHNEVFAPWVGLDGWGSRTVEQVGVQTDCSSGSPVNTAWYEMYPASPVYWQDPVSEGDSITASVTSDGAGGYTMALTNNTKGWTKQVKKTLQAENVSAEAVIESPNQAYPELDSVRFTKVTVDGGSMDALAPQALTSGGYAPGPLQDGSFTIEPSDSNAQSGASNPQPGTSTPQPGDSNPQSGNVFPQPVNPNPQPGNVRPQPVNPNPQPGNVYPQPVNPYPRPGNVYPHPGNPYPPRY